MLCETGSSGYLSKQTSKHIDRDRDAEQMAENRAHDSHAYTRRGIASRFLRFFAVLRIASQTDPWKYWFDNRRRTRCVVCVLWVDSTHH